MRKILIGEAANEIRERLWKLIEVNRRLVVEVTKSADDKLILVVYLRFSGAPWWQIGQFTIEIEDGVAILRDNIPLRVAIAALNAAAGRQVVKVRRFGALCPQCGTAHGEWVNTPAGDHCVFCGWVVGTKPLGHVEVGDRFWIPIMGRVVVHPLTKVRVVEVHNQVTRASAPAQGSFRKSLCRCAMFPRRFQATNTSWLRWSSCHKNGSQLPTCEGRPVSAALGRGNPSGHPPRSLGRLGATGRSRIARTPGTVSSPPASGAVEGHRRKRGRPGPPRPGRPHRETQTPAISRRIPERRFWKGLRRQINSHPPRERLAASWQALSQAKALAEARGRPRGCHPCLSVGAP
jgi:hypothetical protein